MATVARNIALSLSALLMLVLQPSTLLAMVIAPQCSGIMQLADRYRFESILLFSVSYYFLVWRKVSLIAAVVIPAVRIALGWLFIRYINNLPMSCSQ